MTTRDYLFVGCERGHDWQSIGGCNAGCDPDYCGCSVPVNVCARCGDSDYGDNDEAEKVRADCKILQAEDDIEEGFDAGEWNNT